VRAIPAERDRRSAAEPRCGDEQLGRVLARVCWGAGPPRVDMPSDNRPPGRSSSDLRP